MSSQSAGGGNPIVIPVVIDTAAAQAGLVKLKQVAVAESNQVAGAVDENMQRAERSAVKLPAEAAKATQTWTASLATVRPAISGTAQALALMGTQATPAITGLTHALSSMVSTGLNPILLAGVGGSILLGALLGSDAEYTERMDRAKADLKELQDLNEVLRRKAVEREGGPSVEMQGSEARKNAALRDLAAAESLVAMQKETIRTGTAGGIDTKADFDRLRELIAEAAVLRRTYEEAKTVISQVAKAEAEDPRRLDRYKGQGSFDLLPSDGAAALARSRNEAFRAPIDADLGRQFEQLQADMQAGFDAKVSEFGRGDGQRGGMSVKREALQSEKDLAAALGRRKELDLELRSIESGMSTERLGLLDQIALKEQELAAIRAQGSVLDEQDAANKEAELDALRQQLQLVRQIDAKTEAKRSPQAKAEVDKIGDELRQTSRSALTSGISDALNDPSNLRGALSSFASSLQRAASDALAASLVEGLIGKSGKEGGGLLGGLFTAGSAAVGASAGGGGAAGAEAGAGAAPTKRSGQPIVVIPVFDENTANAMAAKVSGTGARALVARSQGGGVSAGVIPAGGA